MSFLCIFYWRFEWTCHFWKPAQKNLNLQISTFSKIATFYPNLIIFFQWKLRLHTFQIFRKFLDFGIFRNFPTFRVKLASARARACAHMNVVILGYQVAEEKITKTLWVSFSVVVEPWDNWKRKVYFSTFSDNFFRGYWMFSHPSELVQSDKICKKLCLWCLFLKKLSTSELITHTNFNH